MNHWYNSKPYLLLFGIVLLAALGWWGLGTRHIKVQRSITLAGQVAGTSTDPHAQQCFNNFALIAGVTAPGLNTSQLTGLSGGQLLLQTVNAYLLSVGKDQLSVANQASLQTILNLYNTTLLGGGAKFSFDYATCSGYRSDGPAVQPNGNFTYSYQTQGTTPTGSPQWWPGVQVTLNATTSPATSPEPLGIATQSLPGGNVGMSYTQNITASGTTPPVTLPLKWSVSSGSLPAGFTLTGYDKGSIAQIVGTPATAGTYTFTVQVKDSSTPQNTASKQYTLKVTGGSTPAPPAPAFECPSKPRKFAFNGSGGIGALLEIPNACVGDELDLYIPSGFSYIDYQTGQAQTYSGPPHTYKLTVYDINPVPAGAIVQELPWGANAPAGIMTSGLVGTIVSFHVVKDGVAQPDAVNDFADPSTALGDVVNQIDMFSVFALPKAVNTMNSFMYAQGCKARSWAMSVDYGSTDKNGKKYACVEAMLMVRMMSAATFQALGGANSISVYSIPTGRMGQFVPYGCGTTGADVASTVNPTCNLSLGYSNTPVPISKYTFLPPCNANSCGTSFGDQLCLQQNGKEYYWLSSTDIKNANYASWGGGTPSLSCPNTTGQYTFTWTGSGYVLTPLSGSPLTQPGVTCSKDTDCAAPSGQNAFCINNRCRCGDQKVTDLFGATVLNPVACVVPTAGQTVQGTLTFSPNKSSYCVGDTFSWTVTSTPPSVTASLYRSHNGLLDINGTSNFTVTTPYTSPPYTFTANDVGNYAAYYSLNAGGGRIANTNTVNATVSDCSAAPATSNFTTNFIAPVVNPVLNAVQNVWDWMKGLFGAGTNGNNPPQPQPAQPYFTQNGAQTISLTCGLSEVFNVPGYSQVWLVQTKNGAQSFNGVYNVPSTPYSPSCTTDLGTYVNTAYTVVNGGQGQYLGSVTATISASAAPPNGTAPISISPSTVPDGSFATAYNQTFTASGGGSGPFVWSLASGTLPTGLSLDTSQTGSTSAISGTPTSHGTYSFAVKVSNGSNSVTQNYTFMVSSPNGGGGGGGGGGPVNTDCYFYNPLGFMNDPGAPNGWNPLTHAPVTSVAGCGSIWSAGGGGFPMCGELDPFLCVYETPRPMRTR